MVSEGAPFGGGIRGETTTLKKKKGGSLQTRRKASFTRKESRRRKGENAAILRIGWGGVKASKKGNNPRRNLVGIEKRGPLRKKEPTGKRYSPKSKKTLFLERG